MCIKYLQNWWRIISKFEPCRMDVKTRYRTIILKLWKVSWVQVLLKLWWVNWRRRSCQSHCLCIVKQWICHKRYSNSVTSCQCCVCLRYLLHCFKTKNLSFVNKYSKKLQWARTIAWSKSCIPCLMYQAFIYWWQMSPITIILCSEFLCVHSVGSPA